MRTDYNRIYPGPVCPRPPADDSKVRFIQIGNFILIYKVSPPEAEGVHADDHLAYILLKTLCSNWTCTTQSRLALQMLTKFIYSKSLAQALKPRPLRRFTTSTLLRTTMSEPVSLTLPSGKTVQVPTGLFM